MIGSFLGAGIADLLSGQHLQLLIGVFAVVMAYRMFKGAHVVVDPTRQLPSTLCNSWQVVALVLPLQFLVLEAEA